MISGLFFGLGMTYKNTTMSATRLTLSALIALAALGCGKEDRTAPPRNPGDAGRDAGPAAGGGGDRADGGPSDAGLPSCLRSGGAGTVMTLDGERVEGSVEGVFTVESREVTTEGPTTTLALEIFGGDIDIDIDAGGEGQSYRVELIMTALPADQVRVGDVLGIVWNTHDSIVGQASTLIATRDEGLLFFAVHSGPELRDGESLLPALEPFGITIGAGPESCEFPAPPCNFREHALRVTSGDEEATVSESGLAQVGDLIVAGRVLELLPSQPGCESYPTTVLASGYMKRN